MKIKYLGHSCFVVKDEISFLFDPYEKVGYEMDETYADVTFCSHSHFDHHALGRVNTLKVIDEPFEGRAFTLAISSISCAHDDANGSKRGLNNVYKVIKNGKTFVHLGDIGTVDENAIEFAKGCDILFIPVGGFYTIDAMQAKELIDKIEPKFAIPMHYKTKTGNINIAKIDEFLSLFDSVNYVENECDYDDLRQGVNVFKF